MSLPSLAQLEPTHATAGDTWQWQRSFADYPIADGWVLSYAANGPKKLTWSGSWVTNDGTQFTVTVPPASTAPLTAGTYELTAILTGSSAGTGLSNGQRVSLPCPALLVVPDPATQSDGSRVSHAERALAVIEAAIENRLTDDMQAYTIGSRQITKIPVLELKKLRRQYRSELWALRNPGRSAPSRLVTFRRPGVYAP